MKPQSKMFCETVCKVLLVTLCAVFVIACTGNVSDCSADAENEGLANNDNPYYDPNYEYVGGFRLVDVPDDVVSRFDELEPAIKLALKQYSLEVDKVSEQGSIGGCWDPDGSFSRTYTIQMSGNISLTVGLSITAFEDIWVFHEGVVQNAENRLSTIDLDLIVDLFNSLSVAPVTTDELDKFLQDAIRDDWNGRVGYWNECPCSKCCHKFEDWGAPGSRFMEYHFGAYNENYIETLNITSLIRR